jgi:glycosidase
MPCVDDAEEILKAVGYNRGELNQIFNFNVVDLDQGPLGKFTPNEFSIRELKRIVTKWQTFMLANDGWNAIYQENHDQSRTVSRYCSDLPEFREVSSKMLATFQLCQSGTPYIYQGQELGMINIEASRPIEEYDDLETLNWWNE